MANWDSDESTHGFDFDSEERVETSELETDEASEAVEIGSTPNESKKRRRARTQSFTRAQVHQVLDTFEAVQQASAGAQNVLRAAVRAEDAGDGELTAALLTQDKNDNPLTTISELREALAASPFTVPAIIAGMDKGKRARAYATMIAATGDTDSLASKDVEAAAQFAQRLSELTDEQIASLVEAQELGY